MECCGKKMKVVKSCSANNLTYRAYKCVECGKYRYSEEKCTDGAKGALSRISYAKLKKIIEK